METIVWACGGGTQSAAIAALIVQGKLPKPDVALMVDTEREKSGTWEFVRGVLVPNLHAAGVDLAIIPKSRYATVDLYSGNGDLLLPGYTRQRGKVAKMPTFCSNEWKQRVARRYLRDLGVETCIQWLGFSLDEVYRMKDSGTIWVTHEYPLIDLRMRRSDCVALVEAMGWGTPPRSACWMCPNMGDWEWKKMREEYPADFARAVQLEREIRATDPDFYLHKSGRPLDMVDFTSQQSFEEIGCASGMCFV